MLTSKVIYSQIQKLTAELIETGLCDAQNFPSMVKRNGGIEDVADTGTEQIPQHGGIRMRQHE